nr:hypothetical protein [Corynebacterium tuberculostearicum]
MTRHQDRRAIIGIYESTGPRVQEGIVTMAGYARLMARVSQASGLIRRFPLSRAIPAALRRSRRRLPMSS